MAEVVQRHMESTTEEMAEIRRSQIFTDEEIRAMVKKRREFEYKINGVSKHLQDFKEFINYELSLVKKIRTKRDKSMISERKHAIEYKILRRVKNLYEIALRRFSTDFSLCLNYFHFCKQYNYTNAANVTVESMLKNWSHNPKVWQIAASWNAIERNDIKNALKILRKSLTIHKDNQMLFTEAIRLELSVIKDTSGDGDDVIREIVLKKLETYVNLICNTINDGDFLIEILGILESYKYSESVQNLIIKKLMERYCDKAFVWRTLATRELQGLHYNTKGDDEKPSESCLHLCLAKFQEGLLKVENEEKPYLWSQYLECLVRLQNEENELSDEEKVDLLKSALEKASNDNVLTEEYYIEWLRHVSDNEALSILKKGTESLPESQDLWKLRLRYATLTNETVDRVFDEGCAALKEHSLPLWQMYLRYYGLLSRDDVIEKTYKLGIRQSQEISEVLKPKYIEWLALAKDMDAARAAYKSLAYETPYCKELHFSMSKLESTEIDFNYDKWAEVHELACTQFGETDVDVWINHIMFYLHFNKSANFQDKVKSICSEAERKLSPLLLPDFKEKYTCALQQI